jgi:hypothetical protein
MNTSRCIPIRLSRETARRVMLLQSLCQCAKHRIEPASSCETDHVCVFARRFSVRFRASWERFLVQPRLSN